MTQRKVAFEDGDVVKLESGSVGIYSGDDWLGLTAPEGKVWVVIDGDVAAVDPAEISKFGGRVSNWRVLDDEFNQANHPDLAGKVFDYPIPYARVEKTDDPVTHTLNPGRRSDERGPFPVEGSRQRKSMRTEAEIVRDLEQAEGLQEQRELVRELEQFRAARTAAVQADRDIDIANAFIRDTLTPVLPYQHHTAATDWIEEEASSGPYDHTMRVEATMWFKRVSPEVKADREEFAEQAQGMARRVSGQFGLQAEAAYHSFLETVARLHKMAVTDTCTQCGKQIYTEDGVWVDNSGGDVCGVLGGNEPHVPSLPLSDEAQDSLRRSREGRFRRRADDKKCQFCGVTLYGEPPYGNCLNNPDGSTHQASLHRLADDKPGEVDEDQSGNAESAVTDYDTDADQEPFLGEDWEDGETGVHPPMPGAGEGGVEPHPQYDTGIRPHSLRRQAVESIYDFPEGSTATCVQCGEPILLDQREGGGPAKDWGSPPEDWVGNGGIGMDYGCSDSPLNDEEGTGGHSPKAGTIKFTARKQGFHEGDPWHESYCGALSNEPCDCGLYEEWPELAPEVDPQYLIDNPQYASRRRASLTKRAEQTCDVCGDSIEKDPAHEDPQTWHHNNGEKHDHEAKPSSESKESRRRRATSCPYPGCRYFGTDVEHEHEEGTAPAGTYNAPKQGAVTAAEMVRDAEWAVLDAEFNAAFAALKAAGLEADADDPIAARYRAASDAVNHANRSRDWAIATGQPTASRKTASWGEGDTLVCDGWCGGKNECTMIDQDGYIYCEPCGMRRRQGQPCRKLTQSELATLRSGQPLKSYSSRRTAAAEILNIKKQRGVAGEYAYTAQVQYEDEDPMYVSFYGSTYGPPIVMEMDNNPKSQVFVSDPTRFGEKLDEEWVRNFFKSASKVGWKASGPGKGRGGQDAPFRGVQKTAGYISWEPHGSGFRGGYHDGIDWTGWVAQVEEDSLAPGTYLYNLFPPSSDPSRSHGPTSGTYHGFSNEQRAMDDALEQVERWIANGVTARRKTAGVYCKTHDVWVGDGNADTHENCDKEQRATEKTKDARRVAGVSLTNVSLDGPGVGKGKDSSGNEVRFRLSPEDEENLKTVLFGDLAVNFSGVTVDDEDIIKSSRVAKDITQADIDAGVDPVDLVPGNSILGNQIIGTSDSWVWLSPDATFGIPTNNGKGVSIKGLTDPSSRITEQAKQAGSRGDLDPSVAHAVLMEVMPSFATRSDGGLIISQFLEEFYASDSTDMFAFGQKWAQGEPLWTDDSSYITYQGDPHGGEYEGSRRTAALDDIVAYTYKADIYCPEHILDVMGQPDVGDVEGALDDLATQRGIDRYDERSFDSGDFPKVVFRDQAQGETCGMGHEIEASLKNEASLDGLSLWELM